MIRCEWKAITLLPYLVYLLGIIVYSQQSGPSFTEPTIRKKWHFCRRKKMYKKYWRQMSGATICRNHKICHVDACTPSTANSNRSEFSLCSVHTARQFKLSFTGNMFLRIVVSLRTCITSEMKHRSWQHKYIWEHKSKRTNTRTQALIQNDALEMTTK